MAFYYKPLFVVLYLLILADVNLVSLAKATKKGGITVDFIHRDSPLSPYYNLSITHYDRLNRAFQRSFARKSAIALAYKKSMLESLGTSKIDIPLNPVLGREFLMKIGIGTPPVEVFAMADTGSDMTWMQCEPCINCYKQIAPIFDPKSTTTYRTIPCQSPQCPSFASCDSSNGCQYQASYIDKSNSIGTLALETLTLGLDSEDTMSFPDVVFGCGHDNQLTWNEEPSGIVGLNGGPLSIVNQLINSTIGGKFSYCLTYFDSPAPGKISFGSDASVTGPNVLSTPLIRKSSDIAYHLTLEGISVGNKRFDYAPFARSKALCEEGNIIIDSGSSLTFLPADLYNNLESALVETIRGRRAYIQSPFFRLCYDVLTDDGVLTPPPIVAHFTGADLVLPQRTTFIEVLPGVACLTLIPSPGDLALFGNMQQINYHIEYDLVNQQINFLPMDCSKSY